MFERDGERDLNFAVSQAKLRAAGTGIPEDSPARSRLLSALLWSLSAVAVCIAWLVGGAKPAIITAVVCLVLLVGASVAIGMNDGRSPRRPDPALPPPQEP